MTRKSIPTQENSLFDFSDIEQDPATDAIAKELEQIEEAVDPDNTDVTMRQVESWDFSNLPPKIKIADSQDLRVLAEVTDNEDLKISNLEHNGGISEKAVEKAVLGIRRARRLRGENKPRPKKQAQPRGLNKSANKLSLKEKAARDKGSVPAHERVDALPPYVRAPRKAD